jgi:hypothetical protein
LLRASSTAFAVRLNLCANSSAAMRRKFCASSEGSAAEAAAALDLAAALGAVSVREASYGMALTYRLKCMLRGLRRKAQKTRRLFESPAARLRPRGRMMRLPQLCLFFVLLLAVACMPRTPAEFVNGADVCSMVPEHVVCDCDGQLVAAEASDQPVACGQVLRMCKGRVSGCRSAAKAQGPLFVPMPPAQNSALSQTTPPSSLAAAVAAFSAQLRAAAPGCEVLANETSLKFRDPAQRVAQANEPMPQVVRSYTSEVFIGPYQTVERRRTLVNASDARALAERQRYNDCMAQQTPSQLAETRKGLSVASERCRISFSDDLVEESNAATVHYGEQFSLFIPGSYREAFREGGFRVPLVCEPAVAEMNRLVRVYR